MAGSLPQLETHGRCDTASKPVKREGFVQFTRAESIYISHAMMNLTLPFKLCALLLLAGRVPMDSANTHPICTRCRTMANTDAVMTVPYEDSEFYIEDRRVWSTFHQRKSAGAWIGDTYVAGLGDSLDVPPPPRSQTAVPVAAGLSAPPRMAAMPDTIRAPNPTTRAPVAAREYIAPADRGWGASAWGPAPAANPFSHKHSSGDLHHWESPQHQSRHCQPR
jgi:hypothetical protein